MDLPWTKYGLLEKLGEGSFGAVYKAINMENGELVAIKRLKQVSNFSSMKDCENTISEVKIQSRLGVHVNVIQLQDVYQESGYLHMVFDLMESNLHQVLESRKRTAGISFPESQIRNFLFQLLKGLEYIHSHGYMHRDLKPENVLATTQIDQLKIADFGSACEINESAIYTDYVTTRWYRAPEVLLQATNYDDTVDMWALGAIMAKMYLLRPLFPGRDMVDQLQKIANIMGTPSREDWPLGHDLAATMGLHFEQIRLRGDGLAQLIPAASKSAIDLMYRLLSWNPKERITAREALEHPFFKDRFKSTQSISPSTRYSQAFAPPGFPPLSWYSQAFAPPGFPQMSYSQAFAPPAFQPMSYAQAFAPPGFAPFACIIA